MPVKEGMSKDDKSRLIEMIKMVVRREQQDKASDRTVEIVVSSL